MGHHGARCYRPPALKTVLYGMTTANCCIVVDFAASKPGAPTGPSKWTTTRNDFVFVQTWVMRLANATPPGPATAPLSNWLL